MCVVLVCTLLAGRNLQAAAPVPPAAPAAKSSPARHWAFVPLTAPKLPEVVDARWSTSPVDRLIAATHQRESLAPAPRADRATLVRRLFLDLIGLPPSREEAETWIDPELPLSTLVDELLGRPEFGERWGRHWLDVARYADTNGCSIEANNTYNNAWRYRDYVITAFNRDKPFDQFVREQVAGDLLDAVSDQQRAEQIIATGFLQLGPKAFGTSGFDRFRLDVIDEQIDTIGKAFIGVALGARDVMITSSTRCRPPTITHSPGSSRARRACWSIERGGAAKSTIAFRCPSWSPRPRRPSTRLTSSESRRRSRGTPPARPPKHSRRPRPLSQRSKQQGAQASSKELEDANRRVGDAQRAVGNAGRLAKVLPQLKAIPVAMAVEEGQVVDEAIRLGGVYDRRGETVVRSIPFALGSDPGPLAEFAIPADQSGRRQLAEWLTDVGRGAGPLVARVNANRIFTHLFGTPIVATIDNFGVSGSRPTQPQLLEYLACSFVAHNWSVKALVRELVLSEAYQLAAVDNPASAAIDPGNLRYWRHTPRRLDAEALRDALLMIAGNLDPTRGGRSLQHAGLLSISSDHIDLDTPSPYLRRTVYLPVVRDALGITPAVDRSMAMLATFDFATPNLVCGGRETTTVPRQALFLLNDAFLLEQAETIAANLLADPQLESDSARISEFCWRALGRAPTRFELDQMLQYLADFPSADEAVSPPPRETWTSLCQAILASNEFLFVQ